MEGRKPYRELTPLSLIGGILAGMVLNVGIVFAGMQIGFTIVGSTVGAILGFGFLRGILRKGSILEVNIFQTVASSVNTVNSGVIFTVPVLFLLGMQDQISYPGLILATMAGSVLGVVMIIPLRKQIIDYERLRFPSAVGVAAILRSPGAGKRKAQLLMVAILVSMLLSGAALDWETSKPLNLWLFELDLTGAKALIPDHFELGRLFGIPSGIRFVFAMSLLSLGAGYLAGQPGLAILYGTILNFWFLIPAAVSMGWIPAAYADFSIWDRTDAGYDRADEFSGAFAHFTSRHVGIGMILGGALAGVFIALPALKAAFASLKGGTTGKGERQEEISIQVLGVGLVVGMVALLIGAKLSGGDSLGWGPAILATLAGGVWLWLAGLVVAQTTGRTDWSPLSGLALIAVAIVMAIVGTNDAGIVPAVTIGAAICVATSMCADMMADFKTGYLVGGIPRKQQLAQIATCWIGPGIALGTVIILWQAYGFGPDQAQILFDRATAAGGDALATFTDKGGSATSLPMGTPELGAPQAGALQGAIDIIQRGDVAVGKYLTGAALGLVVSLLVSPGLGVMVGLSMYLPFEYMIVFGMGGIISILVRRWKGARTAEDLGVPIAAGLIVGDALVNVLNAVIKVIDAV